MCRRLVPSRRRESVDIHTTSCVNHNVCVCVCKLTHASVRAEYARAVQVRFHAHISTADEQLVRIATKTTTRVMEAKRRLRQRVHRFIRVYVIIIYTFASWTSCVCSVCMYCMVHARLEGVTTTATRYYGFFFHRCM